MLGAVEADGRQPQRGGQGPAPGDADERWRYSTLGRDSLSTDQGGLLEAAVQGSALTPPPPRKVAWLAPALLLLLALFLQSGGLYLATQSYVRWMDELGVPLARSGAEPQLDLGPVLRMSQAKLQDSLTLPDEWSARLSGFRMPDVSPDAEFFVDFTTSLVSVSWLGWVVRTQNLRLWTKTLLTGVLLATLKGFLAWATVLPDPAGWSGCRERLGDDGLMYYRSVAAGIAGHRLNSLQALLDISLLEIRSLWLMGRASRQRVCADTVFSSATCFGVLVSVGLYDAVRGSTEALENTRRSTVRSLIGLVLGLVLVLDLALTIASPYHYALDVVVALVLTLLVYGNPAVALAAELWVETMEAHPHSASPGATPSSWAAFASGMEAMVGLLSGSAGMLRDLGQVAVPPCCIPFCGIGGLYYLRPQPGASPKRPWTEDSARQHERQLDEFVQIRDRDAARRRVVEDALDREHARAARREAEAAAEVGRRLDVEKGKLQAAEERAFSEARRRLEELRLAASELESKAAAETKRASLIEGGFAERRSQLESETRAAQGEAEALRGEARACQG